MGDIPAGLAGKKIVQISITNDPKDHPEIYYLKGSVHALAISATGVVYTWVHATMSALTHRS